MSGFQQNSDQFDAFQLPFEFDRNALAKDAESLEGLRRQRQPGPYHKGEWTGVAIHSPGGLQSAAPAFPTLENYRFTPEASRAPYLKSILSSLPFCLQLVRVLWLPPGGVIGSHIDFDTNLQFGLVRLHIPLVTSPNIEFVIADRRYDMLVGDLWYGDFSKPHQVANRGKSDRLHAVVDVEINDALLACMPPEYVARQVSLGPISTCPSELPLTDKEELSSYQCHFFIPGTILPLLVMGKLVDLVGGASAELRLLQSDLVLLLNGVPHCKLIRFAEDRFRILGMPPGCFFELQRSAGTVDSVTLLVRGVQEDLVSARVGVIRGSRIPERKIALEVRAIS